jgi:pyruvate, water dikinase
MIGVHPKALLEFDRAGRRHAREIAERRPATPTRSASTSTSWPRASPPGGRAFAPHPVIVRLSDFKSNEYANLIGGEQYEPHEENPMIGFRGASRYVVSESFRDCFELECRALKKVRDDHGPGQCLRS